MKIYDLVYKLLVEKPGLRSSDKRLIWEVWKWQGIIDGDILYATDYMNRAMSQESIRRARQKIQENHPELGSTQEVSAARSDKQKSKSTFVYREEVN